LAPAPHHLDREPLVALAGQEDDRRCDPRRPVARRAASPSMSGRRGRQRDVERLAGQQWMPVFASLASANSPPIPAAFSARRAIVRSTSSSSIRRIFEAVVHGEESSVS
jgi:hypothetical protein